MISGAVVLEARIVVTIVSKTCGVVAIVAMINRVVRTLVANSGISLAISFADPSVVTALTAAVLLVVASTVPGLCLRIRGAKNQSERGDHHYE